MRGYGYRYGERSCSTVDVAGVAHIRQLRHVPKHVTLTAHGHCPRPPPSTFESADCTSRCTQNYRLCITRMLARVHASLLVPAQLNTPRATGPSFLHLSVKSQAFTAHPWLCNHLAASVSAASRSAPAAASLSCSCLTVALPCLWPAVLLFPIPYLPPVQLVPAHPSAAQLPVAHSTDSC